MVIQSSADSGEFQTRSKAAIAAETVPYLIGKLCIAAATAAVGARFGELGGDALASEGLCLSWLFAAQGTAMGGLRVVGIAAGEARGVAAAQHHRGRGSSSSSSTSSGGGVMSSDEAADRRGSSSRVGVGRVWGWWTMLLHGCSPHPGVKLGAARDDDDTGNADGDDSAATMPFMATVSAVTAVYLAAALAVTMAVIGGSGMATEGGGGKGLEFTRFVVGAGPGALPTVLLYAEEQAMLGLGASGMPMLVGGALYAALTAGFAFAAPAAWGAFGIGVAWSAAAWVAWLATEALVATACRRSLWVWRVSVLSGAAETVNVVLRAGQSPPHREGRRSRREVTGVQRSSSTGSPALAVALAVGNALPLLRQLAIASWIAIEASAGTNVQFSAANAYYQCLLVAALAASSVVTTVAAAAYARAPSQGAARREAAVAGLVLLAAAACAALLPFACPAVFVGFGGDIEDPDLWLFAAASAVGFVAVVAACVCDGVTHGRRVVWLPLALKAMGCAVVVAAAAAMVGFGDGGGAVVGATDFAVAMLLVSSFASLLESATAVVVAAQRGWL